MESSLAKLISLFQGVDSTFSVLLFVSIVLFFAGEAFWIYNSRKSGIPGLNQDDVRLKFMWNIAPAFILLVLLFVHAPRVSKRTADVAKPSRTPLIQPVSVPMPAVPKQGGA